MKPTPGRIVAYTSATGSNVEYPAVVLRTRDSTNVEVIDRWGPRPDGTPSPTAPPGFLAELPDDHTIDLLAHGLMSDYREFAVRYAPGVLDEVTGRLVYPSRTWHWPERV